MRIVLEVSSGLKRGYKVWLRDRQSVSVGSTELADLAVPDDPFLSGIHFKIHSHRECCRVADLESQHGTFVNDQPVHDQMLRDGDCLQAGRTLFAVRING
jgi:pSer/pThr/pTyr-binding forkhead associated (FHA) protein